MSVLKYRDFIHNLHMPFLVTGWGKYVMTLVASALDQLHI
jgi:hypothetical protein